MEQQFKSNLNSVFSDRLEKELTQESEARAAGQFDARGPLGDIQKAIASLGERIDNMGTVPAQGSIIQKSTNSNVEIPSTEELGTMDWSEVHQLAGSVWN